MVVTSLILELQQNVADNAGTIDYERYEAALLEHLQKLEQCNVMRSMPSLPSDKDINEKAKAHQQQFPNNSPMRSYKTGYHHALHDIEKAMPS